ncbi:hypothetical protein [Enterobacter asburiae]|uniref:hypothetical protein n=1 Tax=Enterobacter asburiae TaxID=61645 RepID=UPI003CEE2A05
MSTITKEFTKEQLQQIIETDHVQCGEASSLARIALASLEAEPAIHRWRRVTVEPYGPYPWHYGNFIGFSQPVDGIEDEYFYSAPPAPVSVPYLLEQFAEFMAAESIKSGDYPDGWQCKASNAAHEYAQNIRAAMLQGAENAESPTTMLTAPALDSSPKIAESPSGNSPVIPDGWALVPIEPTAEIISSGIAAHYERSQIQIHDRPAPGPMECAYVAMLAAAPQQEVKP